MWPKFVFIAGEGLSNGVLMVNRDIGVYTGWFNPGYNTLFFVELSNPMHISYWAECTRQNRPRSGTVFVNLNPILISN